MANLSNSGLGAQPDEGLNRPFYLPRLPREFYQGDAVVHWTLPVEKRQEGWLNPLFHGVFRELMLHTAAREGLFCPAYCLMPDHLHLVWMGSGWIRSNSTAWPSFGPSSKRRLRHTAFSTSRTITS